MQAKPDTAAEVAAAELADLMALPADAPECHSPDGHVWEPDFDRFGAMRTVETPHPTADRDIYRFAVRYCACARPNCRARRLRIHSFQTHREVVRYPEPATAGLAC